MDLIFLLCEEVEEGVNVAETNRIGSSEKERKNEFLFFLGSQSQIFMQL
jgi:hypothetical protein